MKKLYPYHISAVCILVCLVGMSGLPQSAAAASSKPTCRMTLSVASVTTRSTNSRSKPILVPLGVPVNLAWESSRATKVVDQNGQSVALDGMATVTPKRSTTYSITVSKGSARTKCSVPVTVVTSSITAQPTGVVSTRPTISGRANGVSSVVVTITPVGTSTPIFMSDTLRVRNGTWSWRVPKALVTSNYQVAVMAQGKVNTPVVATSTLTVGLPSPAGTVAPTVIVQPVPLLIGGVARSGATVAVAYLQVINISTATATIKGFTLRQTGTAPASTMVGMTSVTDNGMARGTVGNMMTGTPFIGNDVVVPLETTLAPREMRLVTIKAVMSPMLASSLGATVVLQVVGVSGSLLPKATFPLFGTVWTIGN